MDLFDTADDSEVDLLDNISTSSSISVQYSAKFITFSLKDKPKEWIIQPKMKQSNMKQSDVWNIFGMPSKMNDFGIYDIIDGYASCFNCYTTYVQKKGTGTNTLRHHLCFKNYILKKEEQNNEKENIMLQVKASPTTSPSSSPYSPNFNPLAKYGLVIKSIKLNSHEKTRIKENIVKWLCQSMRPFSLVNDIGLRNVVQQAISLGAKYGNIDVNSILPGRTTLIQHSKTMADVHREKLKACFIELQMSRALTITPDLWSDKFNSSTYLGITCAMVDSNFSYSTFDLAMHKYAEPDKKAENIITAMHKALLPFDITLSNTNIVCDRGSNFVKCFKYYDPLHCYAHRLNNVIKKCFFQTGKKCTSDASSVSCTTISDAIAANNILNSSDEDSCDEADDECVPSIKIKSKRKPKSNIGRTKITNSSLWVVDHVKLDVSDIPIEAREYLIKLKEVKHIIKYVKKAGLNDEIKATASVSLKQSTSVRWLSLINSLQSLLRAYKATKKVLQKHDRQVYIDPNDLKWIIRLLLPFKVIVEKVQTGNNPSLHMVLLSTFMLRRILSTTEELQHFNANFNNQEEKGENIDFDERLCDEDDELNIENEPSGILFFRERLSSLLENMFQLDIRHYAAVLLHPKYSKMFGCSKNEIEQTYKWIREELKKVNITDTGNNSVMVQSPLKKKKKSSLFEMFSNSSIINTTNINLIGNEEDDNDEDQNTPMIAHDELNHYLFLIKKTENEPESQDENPLPWWKKYSNDLRKLSVITRRIFSITATSASVERQFSTAGVIFNDRRTRISSENLENIILIRSIENQDKNNIGMLE